MTIERIRQLFNIIDRSIFTIKSPLDYDRTIKAITLLAGLVHDYASENDEIDSLWAIGDTGSATLPDLLAGSYWFCVHNSGNEFSPEYAAQCAIGRVYSPGPIAKHAEPDSGELETYDGLWQLLNESNK